MRREARHFVGLPMVCYRLASIVGSSSSLELVQCTARETPCIGAPALPHTATVLYGSVMGSPPTEPDHYQPPSPTSYTYTVDIDLVLSHTPRSSLKLGKHCLKCVHLYNHVILQWV